jgi:hypothetical protein
MLHRASDLEHSREHGDENFRFHKTRVISWLTEWLSVSHEDLWFMKLTSYFDFHDVCGFYTNTVKKCVFHHHYW